MVELNKIPHIDEIANRGTYAGPKAKKTENFATRTDSPDKILATIEDAVKATGLKDGMTISFHHHFRGGDHIVNQVVDVLAKMGFKNLTLAASSLSGVHAPLIDHIKNGVISHIETSGLRGELAEQISRGLMEFPIVFRSHGGRAAAIDSGELHIDVAFLGAPSCDPYGNANGYSRDDDDSILCGSMGYAVPDATHADKVVVLTNNLVKYPNMPCAIPEHQVDYIVVIDDIGDPKGIMSGATRYTKNPKELLIAQTAAEVIDAAGYFYDGFSMQMGSGGASLAAARYLRQMMIDKGIKCRFALGGITGQIASMHEEGLVERILDVQSFDLDAAQSLKKNFDHHQISATYYASFLQDAAVDQLDFVILSALEIDTDFNVNVLTGSDGVIRGAIGGHPDTAAGASLAVVVAPLTRGRIPSIIDKVNTVVTPGATVDVVVTDQGVAVNPNRPEVAEKLKAAGIKVFTIEQLKAKAEAIVGKPEPIRYKDNIVGVVMYRDNTVIDVIRQIEE
ncbi:MAG: citrate lyase subunit alpha [Clostridia bacterium]|jgi:citrate lyase subunit alpha/citrate CoA-transferase|nr:citrate lyase subunit alpha [Clostridia bacterium]